LVSTLCRDEPTWIPGEERYLDKQTIALCRDEPTWIPGKERYLDKKIIALYVGTSLHGYEVKIDTWIRRQYLYVGMILHGYQV
jgi:hypothetical protein